MADHFGTEFVQQHIDRALAYQQARTMGVFRYLATRFNFDSPLELAFALWWYTIDDEEFMSLHSQVQVLCGEERFRVDFAIERRGIIPADTPPMKVAIELDGHDFHERTKEQVTYRNARDRQLTEAGWVVLHFSGSEFHRDPEKCIKEVQQAAWKRL